MIFIVIFGAIVVLSFGGVLLFGAPYLPTLRRQAEVALELVDLKPGQTLLELGCGDGKVMIAAAQTGLHVVGYELNPFLAFIAWVRTRRFRKQVKVVWGDFWSRPWPAAEGIFVFLHPRFMQRLDKKIVQFNSNNVKLVSFAFEVPGRSATREKQGVYMYSYDANVLPSDYDKA